MVIPNILNTGRSGLMASKAGIASTGHNIANVNTEGFSRQRVITRTSDPQGGALSKITIGSGTQISRVERINDEYIDRQIRNAAKDLSQFEEKELALSQCEEIFNELNGEGINRLIAQFFNDFRKLSEEPENTSVRQVVRESSQLMVNDFHRLRQELEAVKAHLDARIQGTVDELNTLTSQVAALNRKIIAAEAVSGTPNDLMDQRDVLTKKIASYLPISVVHDEKGNFNIDIPGVGPLVVGVASESLSTQRTEADDRGKEDGSLDLYSSGNVHEIITHQIASGKLGGLLAVRDQSLSQSVQKLDELAYQIIHEVNKIHEKGYTISNRTGVCFFKPLDQKNRAAEWMDLSQDIREHINHIATAATPNAPGDNRIALAIASIQNEKVLGDGFSTMDEWYNSIVSDLGVVASKNKFSLAQQKEIMAQLSALRDQLAGVSIDEETTHLLEFQHAYDASAKVIQIADEMLKTVLDLKRS